MCFRFCALLVTFPPTQSPQATAHPQLCPLLLLLAPAAAVDVFVALLLSLLPACAPLAIDHAAHAQICAAPSWSRARTRSWCRCRSRSRSQSPSQGRSQLPQLGKQIQCSMSCFHGFGSGLGSGFPLSSTKSYPFRCFAHISEHTLSLSLAPYLLSSLANWAHTSTS